MAEGEVLQLEYQGSTQLTQKVYLALIFKKTAVLMGTSTGATAILHSDDPRAFKALKSYGLHLGFAFQIMDDILDYTGSEDGIGKERFKDIKEGKVTLPLLFALNRASKPERQLLEGVIAEREVPQSAEMVLLEILDRTKGVTQAKRMAESFVSKAENDLGVFGNTPEVSDLKLLGRFVLERTH
jgi:octaprenyl-diphosphate synthase